MIAELPRYQNIDAFNDAEKAAIRLADVLAGDHKAASEDLFDELRKHYSESEIMDLSWRISSFIGYGRLIRVLGLEIGETCPLGHDAGAAGAS